MREICAWQPKHENCATEQLKVDYADDGLVLLPRLSVSSGAAEAAICRPVQVLPAKRGILAMTTGLVILWFFFHFLPRLGKLLSAASELKRTLQRKNRHPRYPPTACRRISFLGEKDSILDTR